MPKPNISPSQGELLSFLELKGVGGINLPPGDLLVSSKDGGMSTARHWSLWLSGQTSDSSGGWIGLGEREPMLSDQTQPASPYLLCSESLLHSTKGGEDRNWLASTGQFILSAWFLSASSVVDALL